MLKTAFRVAAVALAVIVIYKLAGGDLTTLLDFIVNIFDTASDWVVDTLHTLFG